MEPTTKNKTTKVLDFSVLPKPKEDIFSSYILPKTLGYEGGYTVDHAGPTNFGITQSAYDSYTKRKKLPFKSVKELKEKDASDVYREDYFDNPKISSLHGKKIQALTFDFGVNAGTKKAVSELQKIIGANPDGFIGPETQSKLKKYIDEKGEDELGKEYLKRRDEFNSSLINKDPNKYKKYEKGWKSRIDKLRKDFDLSMLNPLAAKEAFADEMPTKVLDFGKIPDKENFFKSALKTAVQKAEVFGRGFKKALRSGPQVVGAGLEYAGAGIEKSEPGLIDLRPLGKEIRRAGIMMLEKNKSALAKKYPQEAKGIDRFIEDLGSGTVSVGASIGLGLLTGGASLSGAAFGASQTFRKFHDLMTDPNVKPEVKNAAHQVANLYGVGEGSLEYFGLHSLLSSKGTQLARALKAIATGSIQEGSQQFTESEIDVATGLSHKKGLEAQIDVVSQTLYAAALGAILEAPGSVAVSTAQKNNVVNALQTLGMDKETANKKTDEILKKFEDEELYPAILDVMNEVGVAEDQEEYGKDLKFKNTEEAINYGKSIRGNNEQIKLLQTALDNKYAETDKFHSIKNPSDEQLQQSMNLATEGQFLREALQAANGDDFSVKNEKNLVAMHNISAEGLIHADKMGGLAVPSLSIGKSEHPLEGFGEITLLGSKELIDPKKQSNKVFNADIYSPRYPGVKYDFDSTTLKEARKSVSQEEKDLGRQLGTDLDSGSFNHRGMEALYRSAVLQLKFLRSIGKDIKIPKKSVSGNYLQLNPSIEKFVDTWNPPTDLYENKEFIAEYEKLRRENMKNVENESLLSGSSKEEAKEIAEEEGKLWYEEDGTPNYNIVRNLMDEASQKKEAGKPDYRAAEILIENEVRPLSKQYNEWVDKNYSNIIGKERLYNGEDRNYNARYLPHTLQNVVRIMKRELQSGEGFNYGLGNVRASVAKRYGSIKEIQNDRGKILSKVDFEKVKEFTDNEFDEIISEAYAKYKHKTSSFGIGDTFTTVLIDGIKHHDIAGELKEYGFEGMDVYRIKAFLDVLKDMPTEYFEAKLQRAVGIDEFSGAIVPYGTNERAIRVLERNEIPYVMYDSKKEGDRARAVKELSQQRTLLFDKQLTFKDFEDNIAFGGKNEKQKAIQKAADEINGIRLQRYKGSEGVQKKPSQIVQELLEKGWTKYTGKECKNADDAAEIFAAARNPYIEVFQALIIKDGKVIGHKIVSNGLPNQVRDADILANDAALEAGRLNADTVYIGHNHPSGDPNPSPQDQRFTSVIEESLAKMNIGFGGHIITDGNNYFFMKKRQSALTPWKQSKEHLGRGRADMKITSPTSAANTFKSYLTEGKIIVILTDTKHQVVSIESINPSKNIMADIANVVSDNVASSYLVAMDKSAYNEIKGAAFPERLVDAIVYTEDGKYESLEENGLDLKKTEISSIKPSMKYIEEEEIEYEPEKLSMDEIKALEEAGKEFIKEKKNIVDSLKSAVIGKVDLVRASLDYEFLPHLVGGGKRNLDDIATEYEFELPFLGYEATGEGLAEFIKDYIGTRQGGKFYKAEKQKEMPLTMQQYERKMEILKQRREGREMKRNYGKIEREYVKPALTLVKTEIAQQAQRKQELAQLKKDIRGRKKEQLEKNNLIRSYERRVEVLKSKVKSAALKTDIENRNSFTERLNKNIEKYERKIEELRSRIKSVELKQDIIQRGYAKNKDELIKIVENKLPVKIRGRLIRTIQGVKTDLDLKRANELVEKYAERFNRRSLINEINSLVSKAEQSKSVAIDYVEQIRNIFEGFDFVKRRQDTLSKITKLRDWLDRQNAAGQDITLPEYVYERLMILQQKPIDRITTDELQIIKDSIKLLYERGRTKFEVIEETNKTIVDNALSRLAASTVPINSKESNKKMSVTERPTIGDRVSIAADQKIKQAINTAQLLQLKVASPVDVVMDILDGSVGYTGDNFHVFKQPIDAAWNEQFSRKIKLEQGLIDISNKYKLDDFNFNRIGIYATDQQEGGREHLLAGGLTDQEIDSIKLDDGEKEFYSASRKILDEFYPQIKDAMRIYFNEEIGEVKNYFPYMIDFNKMNSAEIHRLFYDNDETQAVFVGKKGKFKPGFTEERQNGKKALRLNAFRTIMSYIDNATYMLTVGKETKLLQRIALSPKFKEIAGDVGQAYVQDWLDMLARKGRMGNSSVALDVLRRNVGAAQLAYKLSTIVIQTTSLFDAAATIGGVETFGGVRDILTSGEWRSFIQNNFPEIKFRNLDDPAYDDIANWFGFEKAIKLGYEPMKLVDGLVAASSAVGAYKKYLADNGISLDLSKPNKAAIAWAQLMVRRSQSTASTKDIPLAITRGEMPGINSSSIVKMLFQFQNFLLNRWSMLRHDGIRIGLKTKNPKKIANMIMFMIFAGIAENAIRRSLYELFKPKDKKDDKEDGFWNDLAKTFIQNIPVIGSFSSAVQYGGFPVPAISAIQQTLNSFQYWQKSKNKSKKQKWAWVTIMQGLGVSLGVPGTAQAAQIIKKVYPTNNERRKR